MREGYCVCVCVRERARQIDRDRQIEIERDRERVDGATSYSAAAGAEFFSIFADVFLRERNRKRSIGKDRQTENYRY